MNEATDEHGVFEVRATDDVVDGVTVNRAWDQHYEDLHDFCAALTETILAALPPVPPSPLEPPAALHRSPSDELGPMELERSRGFWNEYILWRSKLRKLRERALAGEFPEWHPPQPIDDPERRWIIDFDSAGRFRMIGLAPEFFDSATAASLSNTISEALRDLHLDQSVPVIPEMAEINEHRARYERFLAG